MVDPQVQDLSACYKKGSDEVIRQRAKVAHSISKLKYQWAGLISRSTDTRLGKRLLERTPRLGKRSVGRGWPQLGRSVDLRMAGRSSMQEVEDRAMWRAIGDAYI